MEVQPLTPCVCSVPHLPNPQPYTPQARNESLGAISGALGLRLSLGVQFFRAGLGRLLWGLDGLLGSTGGLLQIFSRVFELSQAFC